MLVVLDELVVVGPALGVHEETLASFGKSCEVYASFHVFEGMVFVVREGGGWLWLVARLCFVVEVHLRLRAVEVGLDSHERGGGVVGGPSADLSTQDARCSAAHLRLVPDQLQL